VDEKLSYLSVTCNAHFTYKSVGEQLFEMAEKHPDHVAFIFHKNDSLKLTYSDLKKRAVVLARNFEAIGLKKGERIALLLPNTYELVICYLAGALIGLVLVPLDQDYGSVELEFMIQKTKPSAIIVYNSEEFEPTVNDLFPDINSFEKGKYETEKFPGLKHVVFLKELNGSHRNVWTWEEINNDVTDNEIYEFPKIEPEEVDFAIMFTVRISLLKLKRF
jgi:acyl-CoA synthetase (AMP-forming)/AMP-acid ligase II